MSLPPPPTGAPQHPWTPPADPYRQASYAVPYQPAPLGPTGTPLDAYGYQLPPPRRRTGLIVACVVAGVLGLVALALVVGALSGLVGGGRAYGDDADLDRLWDACAAGDALSCDDLYLESPVGSEYEEYGDTCGDRFPSGEWCRGRM